MSLSEVYITKTSAFLPNNAIGNDEIEFYLGMVNNQASKSKNIVLSRNKIIQRYYALKKDGTPTHSNAQLVSTCIKSLGQQDPAALKDVDLLCCGTSSPDQLIPSHAVMVHGYLPEIGNIEVVSTAGACCSGMHAFKYAYMALRSGNASKAIAAGSERMSAILRSDHFDLELKKLSHLEEKPILAFEKDFLRWMLSDGAGAFILENKKNKQGLSFKIEWIKGVSYANEMKTCMYMSADKNEQGDLISYMDLTPMEIINHSILSIKQDVTLLGENIVKLGFHKLKYILEEECINIDDITFFLPHMSSHYFEDAIYQTLQSNGLEIEKSRWFTNLSYVGNIGSGSIYVMLHELFQSNKLKIGDKILLVVPESARFSYVYSLLTVC